MVDKQITKLKEEFKQIIKPIESYISIKEFRTDMHVLLTRASFGNPIKIDIGSGQYVMLCTSRQYKE